MKRLSLLLTFAACLAVASCGGNKEDMTPVQPGETVTYKDLVYKFSFKAPKAWVAESVPGKRTAYFSTQSSQTRFQTFTEGDYGAKIETGVYEHQTKEEAAAQFKQNFEGVNFKPDEQTTLGGQPAIKLVFSQGDEEDAYGGYRIFTDRDSLVTYFEAATFGNGRMEKYRPIFDLAEKSVTPAFEVKMDASGKVDSVTQAAMMEDMKPSQTFASFSSGEYSIQYPENFTTRVMGNGVLIKGERNDATVQVDVSDAGDKFDFAKYVDEISKKSYRGAPAQNVNIGGVAGKMINYSLVSAAGSRAYFVPKGTKVYRITINWPSSLEADYKPAVEKSAQSFKLK